MLRPEFVINSWREWDGQFHTRPVIAGPLSGGRSNQSFLLKTDGKRVVLRLNSSDSVRTGANHHNEIEIWKAASLQGIAPPLLYTDKHNSFLVSTYIDNCLPPQPPISDPYIKRALDLLDRCHQLDVDVPSIDYTRHIENYWHSIEAKNQLSNQTLLEQRKPMQSVLESLIASAPTTGLCHHDPVISNFVGNHNRLYLIDWEFAARGLLVMDYAALVFEWGLDKETVLSATGFEPDLLAEAEAVYRYLCELWQEVTR